MLCKELFFSDRPAGGVTFDRRAVGDEETFDDREAFVDDKETVDGEASMDLDGWLVWLAVRRALLRETTVNSSERSSGSVDCSWLVVESIGLNLDGSSYRVLLGFHFFNLLWIPSGIHKRVRRALSSPIFCGSR